MARLFNAYVIVDWSGAESKATGKNSIWIGVLKRDVRFRFAFESHNPPTRREAVALIASILDDRAKHRERTLIGFDFAFGYPRGFAAALKLPGEQPWEAVWSFLEKEVSDKADNMNNRFQVGAKLNRLLTGEAFPFWGCTPKYAQTTIQPTKSRSHGAGDLPEFRHTELTASAKGASSVWKLGYTGSVGGQTLVGIPAVQRLKTARGDRLKVWPFETGWKALNEQDLAGVEVVMAEVYPSLIKPEEVVGEIRDLTQVRALAEYFAKLDEQSKLGAIFAPGQRHRSHRDPRRATRGRLDARRLRVDRTRRTSAFGNLLRQSPPPGARQEWQPTAEHRRRRFPTAMHEAGGILNRHDHDPATGQRHHERLVVIHARCPAILVVAGGDPHVEIQTETQRELRAFAGHQRAGREPSELRIVGGGVVLKRLFTDHADAAADKPAVERKRQVQSVGSYPSHRIEEPFRLIGLHQGRTFAQRAQVTAFGLEEPR